MSITIGDAVLWIRGKSDKLPGDLKQAEGQVKDWGKTINDVFKAVIGVGVTVAISRGIRAITDNLIELGKESINVGREYGKQVDQMRRITGLSVEDSSRLIQIADDMELSYEGLSTAIRMYSMDQGKAGISTQISVDTLADLSDEYMRLAPGTERNTWLIDKFGRSGMQMARLMEQGGDAIREMSDAIEEDLILTEDMIKTQEEYRVSVDNLEDAMSGLKTQLGLALMPLKTEWNQFLIDHAIPILEDLIDLFKQLPGPAQGAIVALVLLGRGASSAAPGIMGAAYALKILGGTGPVLKVLASILKFTLLPALVAVGAYLEFKLIDQLTRSGAKLGQKLAEWTGIWDILPQEVRDMSIALQTEGLFSKAYLDSVGKVIGIFFSGFVKNIGTWLSQAFREFGKFMTSLTKWAMDISKRIGDWGKSIGKNFVTGIADGIKAAWEWLKTTVADLAQTLLQAAKDALEMESPGKAPAREIGRPFAQGIGMGFEQAIPDLVAQIQLALKPVPAMAMAGLGNVSVGHIEYHGAFSRDEMNRLDRRSKRIASDTVEEILK